MSTVLLGALLLVAATAGAARADEMHLLVNGKSIHFNQRSDVDYNESNLGAGLQYDRESEHSRWRPFVTVAGFNDSNRNVSYYAGGGWLYRHHFYAGGRRLHVDTGVVAFAMVRKEYNDGDPFLGVLPAFSLGNDSVAVNMTYIPKVDPKSVPLVFFQLKLRLSAR